MGFTVHEILLWFWHFRGSMFSRQYHHVQQMRSTIDCYHIIRRSMYDFARYANIIQAFYHWLTRVTIEYLQE